MGNSILILFVIFIAYYVSAHHESDHTENPSISLDYNTVTDIIEALTPEDEQTTEIVLDVTPVTDAIINSGWDKPPSEAFLKRISPNAYKVPRRTRQRLVISSHVIDLPEDDIHEQYILETNDPEDKIPPAPCPETVDVDDSPVEISQEIDASSAEMSQEMDASFAESSQEMDDSFVETAEESYGFVGSLKGRPGIDYPNYKEIPLTSFTCAGKKVIPGFYADIETRCQVFHVCYPHRRESFLCPTGTTFNQPIKACDYWYNGNCSSAAEYFSEGSLADLPEEDEEKVLEIIKEVFPEEEIQSPPEQISEEQAEPEVSEEQEIVEIPVEIPQPVLPEPVVPVLKPVVIKPVVSKSVVHKKPSPLSVKVVTMKKFLPIKAKVVKFSTPIVSAKVKIVAAKTQNVVPKPVTIKVRKPVPAKTFKKVVLKPAVVKPIVAKKVLTKAIKAKAAKAIVKKVAISALTKKHLALSLLRMARGHKIVLHNVRRPVYHL